MGAVENSTNIICRDDVGDSNSGLAAVINNGMCIGCGACAVKDERITLKRDVYGAMQATLPANDPNISEAVAAVCPFSNSSKNEDQIADELYRDLSHEPRVGRYIASYAGRVDQGEDITKSSSGGLTSWICLELMNAGLIDGVIHVGSAGVDTDGLFEFCVSRSADEVRARRKSQYYSASFDEVIREVLGDGKRYVLVGVPCFIKAARLLCSEIPELKNQLVYTVALVCGHMKTSRFAELLAWQLSIPPTDLAQVDFRVKNPGKSAKSYKFGAKTAIGEWQTHQSSTLVGANWGHASFQMDACDYCDDIFGETADVALGDAWLDKYTGEWRGTNVLVVRNPIIDKLLQVGKGDHRLFLEDLPIDELCKSQDGNFRHRHDGLSVRLEDRQKAGLWTPVKRIKAGSRKVDSTRRKIVRLRQKLAQTSHTAFLQARENQNLSFYMNAINPLIKQMALLSRGSLFARVARKLKKILPF